MKLLFGTLILGATASVFAQDAPPAPAKPSTPARVAIMPSAGSDVIIAGVTKNAPFTADESGETVRLMADGNRIVESWTGKTARNSEGRIRREVTSGNVGGGAARPFIFDGTLMPAPAVVAVGSGDGATSILRAKIEAETAAGARTIVTSPGGGAGFSVTTAGNGEEAKRVLLTKTEAAGVKEGTWVASGASTGVNAESGVISVLPARRVDDGKVQTRKEDLGTRDFGEVQAEGHRIITTYAAGAIGNERELEVTSEVWFSKDLGVIVYSKRSDPRTGETTYQMTNIVRAEPDASLFQIRGK